MGGTIGSMQLYLIDLRRHFQTGAEAVRAWVLVTRSSSAFTALVKISALVM